MNTVRACVIAGTHSGCGKTSVSLGLMRALTRLGRTVQPYKCGPDFIDPGHHGLACGRISHNLDGWMLSHGINRDIFHREARGADLALVEGVMGLHDGYSGTREEGSTAHMAKQLGLPVVLVVDARAMARSAAALVGGYAGFDPDVKFAGVIFNRVGSESHAGLLRDAMSLLPDIPVLGCLRREEGIGLPSRHLGLHTAEEQEDEDRYELLADWIESCLDLERFCAAIPEVEIAPPTDAPFPAPSVRLGIARDRAFCFYYAENLRLLRQSGAELVEFSPMRDRKLPDDLDALYFGGGYPELYAFELSQNTRMKKQVRAFHESGRPIYAECGGFMYLMNDIISREQGRFAMTGIFPVRASMEQRFRALGYREVETLADSLLGPAGTLARGHEFHYSGIEDGIVPESMPSIYALRDRKGPREQAEGFLIGNTLGSYVHLHFGSSNIPQSMVGLARRR
ncbi:cobyrinate a,c-diamide synthase [Salidesulfovibrio onnuriiensis]|uniref:cobyrinate a,c-diamide synthase n=1 Tax=Salidesulfovibrio onnuriiensis TaxID=2583823 RepID=UPI0011C8366B|nr:cobyrinate a,c-diamide synthase [Salidesulfovibrio onnuriiensis]